MSSPFENFTGPYRVHENASVDKPERTWTARDALDDTLPDEVLL
jgi:hypothetical protein